MDGKTSDDLQHIFSLGADIIKEMDIPLPSYIRVLCIDDSVNDFEILTGVLSRSKKISYKTECANTYGDALMLIKENRHDIYLVDLKLDGSKNGLDLIKESVGAGFLGPFVVWSGYVSESTYEEALNTSTIINYVSKQETNTIVLDNIIRYSIKCWRIYNRVRRFQETFIKISRQIGITIPVMTKP